MKKLLLTLVVAIAGVSQLNAINPLQQYGAAPAPPQQQGGGMFGSGGLFGSGGMPGGGGGFGPQYSAGIGVATAITTTKQTQDGEQNINVDTGGGQAGVQAAFGQTQTSTGGSTASASGQ